MKGDSKEKKVAMPRAHRMSLICCALLIGLFFSCDENNVVVEPLRTGQNQPSIVSSLNTLAISVDATVFSLQSDRPLTFTGDSLLYVLSITSYMQGGGELKVLSASGSVILSDSLKSNTSTVNSNLAGRIPSRFSFSLSNFTGRVSIVLTALGSSGQFRLEDFPTEVWTQWAYTAFDSITQGAYLVMVTVVGKNVLPDNRVVSIWRTDDYSTYVSDSQYVTISKDSMTISHRGRQTLYIFPLQVGSSWKGFNTNDSSTVVHKGPVSVPAGNYQAGFQIRQHWGGLNDYGEVVTWFVPRVGIVELRRKEFGINHINTVWQLGGLRSAH